MDINTWNKAAKNEKKKSLHAANRPQAVSEILERNMGKYIHNVNLSLIYTMPCVYIFIFLLN